MAARATDRRQREIADAKARIREGMSASTNGMNNNPTDALDFIRSNESFQSALGKLGGDATVLYDTEVWSLLQHAEGGTGTSANFGSGRVSLTADETQQLASFLSLSDAVTYDADGSVGSSMALIARQGASAEQVNAKVRDTLGKFVTDQDLAGLSQGLYLQDGLVGRSAALNLMPLQSSVLERFNTAIFADARTVQAADAYESASLDLVNPYRDYTKTYKQVALEKYQRVTSSIRNDLVDQGYLPKRIAFSETANQIYKGIESVMLGVVPAERLAGFALKGVQNVVKTVSTNYRATFFKAYPELEGQVVVHHAIEQQALKRYPGSISEAEIHSLGNLRGIPNELNPSLHLSTIRREWNQFYRQTPNATPQQLVQKAADIDAKYGSQFMPPVGGK